MTKDEFCSALTLCHEIDDYGTVIWYNRDDELHRIDGPALEEADGSKEWYLNGDLHREDGPAVELLDEYVWTLLKKLIWK